MSFTRYSLLLLLIVGLAFLLPGSAVAQPGPPPDRDEAWDEDGPPPGPPRHDVRDRDRPGPPPRRDVRDRDRPGHGGMHDRPGQGGMHDRPDRGPRGPMRDRPGPRRDRPGPPPPGMDREGPEGFRPDRPRGPHDDPDRRGPPEHPGAHDPDRPGPPFGPRHEWEEQRKNDPEMFELMKTDRELERNSMRMAMKYRRAPTEQRSTIKNELTELVNKHFDVRQKRRALELKRIQKELERLKTAIDRRNKARDVIVEKRVLRLLGEDALDF